MVRSALRVVRPAEIQFVKPGARQISWREWAVLTLLAIALRCAWLWFEAPQGWGVELVFWGAIVVAFFAFLGRREQAQQVERDLANGIQIHRHYHYRR